MLFTIGTILVALWLVGLLTAYTLGGFIYAALVLGIILFIAGFFRRSHTHKAQAHQSHGPQNSGTQTNEPLVHGVQPPGAGAGAATHAPQAHAPN